MSQLIKIIYSLNDIDSSISFDPTNKISVFKNLINLTQKINLDEYELFYGKKLIPWNEDRMIKDIIGKELVPLFHIKKKHTASTIVKKLKPIESAKDIIADNSFKTKVIIDYFPSRVEIYTLLDRFYEENNLKKDYHIDHSGSSVEISFKNPDVAFDFTKKINCEKLNNPLYFKIKTKVDFDVKKNHSKHYSKSPEKRSKKDDIFELNEVINNAKLYEKHTLETESPKRRKFLSPDNNNNIKIMRLISHLKDIKDQKVKDKIVKLYYKQAVNKCLNKSSLRISEPYVTEKTHRYHDHLDNKKKWLNQKGMVPSYRNSEHLLPSDVNYNLPYGKPISEYIFRDIYQKKDNYKEK